MAIARVFPRETKATPDDLLAYIKGPPEILPEVDEVHISVSFTFDIPKAERLAEQWQKTGLPVKLGGPLTMSRVGILFRACISSMDM